MTKLGTAMTKINFQKSFDIKIQNFSPSHSLSTSNIKHMISSIFSNLLFFFFSDAISLFILLSFYGLGAGGWFLMVPVLLADSFGVEKIGASYGLVRLFQSSSNLLGPVIAGIIRDQTGSFRYEPVFGRLLILLLGPCLIGPNM